MFGSQIATAFVRIRPNMAGFKSETEAGVRHGFSGLAKIVGLAFGGIEAYRFGKDIIGDAARVQKSVEVVGAQFGKFGEQINKFADGAGIALGLTTHDTEATAARFGILFANLGIGKERAAGMTTGLLKLAGSLSAIKGTDPAAVLERLPLALAGNLRSLKSLGISIDSNQIKIAAWKLGLISTVKDAITPGIKAQAIYALATANLGKFQAQAAKHSHDFVNVQRRLHAEWDRAKEQLGTALLPQVTKVANAFDKWFQRMQKGGKLQKDFNEIADKTKSVVKGVADAVGKGWGVFKTVTADLGGTKQAFVDLLAVIAVSKFAAIAKGMITSMVTNGTRVLAAEFQVAEAEVVSAYGGMELATIGFAATVKAALISTGIGALVVGVGILAAEIITHWSKVKSWFVEFGHWMSSHAKLLLAVPLVGPIAFAAVEIVKHFGEIKKAVVGVGRYFFTYIYQPAKEVFSNLKDVVMAFVHFFGTVFTHPIRAVENLFRDLRTVMVNVFNDMKRIALTAALAIVEPFSHLPSFLGGKKFRSMKSWLQGQLEALEPVAYNEANRIAGIFASTLAVGLSKANPFGKKKEKATSASPFGTPDASIDTKAADKAIANGTAWGKNVVDAATTTIKSGVSGITKAMADATAQAVEAARKRIADSVVAAKNNLDQIGQKLADTVNRLLDKMGGVGASLAGSPQAAAFKKLRDLIAGGGDTTGVERAAQQLSSELQAKSSVDPAGRRDKVKRQIADLTDQFNKGALTLHQFNQKVAHLLSSNHVSYKTAGKKLGVAFSDGFKSQVKGLHDQAAAIAAVPAHLRKLGAGGGDQSLKIIRPLEVMRHENQKLALRAEKQRERLIKASERTAKAAEKQASLAAQAKHTKVAQLPGHTAKKARSAAAAGVQP